MKCPQCHAKTGVEDTRDYGQLVLRARLCSGCGHEFKTREIIDRTPIPRIEVQPGMKAAQRLTKDQQELRIFYQRSANHAVRDAVLAGKLTDLKKVYVPCVDCKTARASQYEHRDYDQPLNVEPVCGKCNLNRGPASFGPRPS